MNDSRLDHCEVCAQANIHRLPIPSTSHRRASRVLFGVHSDICGPFPLGYGNFKYFILFIDDYGRYLGIAFLKSRSEAPERLIEWVRAAEAFLGVKLAVLRVDNAPEYVEGRLRDWCKENGVTFEKIVPDASPQNGVAERVNRTIAAMTRTALIGAKLSDWFWPLTAQASVHVKNIVPHSANPPDITPHETWHNDKPDISHLREFGCKVTSRKTNSDALNKIQPRGEPGIFVGYARNTKGYLIWFPDSHAVRVRRDVIFHDMPVNLELPQPRENDTL